MFNISLHKYLLKSFPEISSRKFLKFYDINIPWNRLQESPQKLLNIRRHQYSDKSPPRISCWGLPQKFLILGHDGFWAFLKIHGWDMHDSDAGTGWDLKVYTEPYMTSVHTLPLDLKLLTCYFSNFGHYHNSGGVMPAMCSPKWNLRWYSDSWDTFRKMMYYICQSPYLAQERSYETI